MTVRVLDTVAAWDFVARRWRRATVVAVNARAAKPLCTVSTNAWTAVVPLERHWIRPIYVVAQQQDARAA